MRQFTRSRRRSRRARAGARRHRGWSTGLRVTGKGTEVIAHAGIKSSETVIVSLFGSRVLAG